MRFTKTVLHLRGRPFFQLSVGKFLKTLNSFQLCTKRKLMTMKRFIAFLSIVLASFGCTKEGRFVWEGNNPEEAEIAHDMIVLGERLPARPFKRSLPTEGALPSTPPTSTSVSCPRTMHRCRLLSTRGWN